jgi:hypothetical protein
VIEIGPEFQNKKDPSMTMPARSLPVVALVVVLFCIPSLAQTPERRQGTTTPQPQEQTVNLPLNASSLDIVANEMGLLRKSVQTLNLRLREISDKVVGPGSSQSGSPTDRTNRLSLNLEILTKAEQRAEALRKELLDRIERETSLRSRLAQNDEEIRPESIERALNPIGSTRTVEMRDTRRRVLENERRGFEALLIQTSQSRVRLEDDVRQADTLVSRLRQRILPLIDKEVEKINPNP